MEQEEVEMPQAVYDLFDTIAEHFNELAESVQVQADIAKLRKCRDMSEIVIPCIQKLSKSDHLAFVNSIKESLSDDVDKMIENFELLEKALNTGADLLQALSLNSQHFTPAIDWKQLSELFGDIDFSKDKHKISNDREKINALTEVLRSPKCRLEGVNLNSQGMNDEGISEIASALEMNKSVKSLTLKGNNFTNLGVEALANMLRINNTLEHLDLTNNDVRSDAYRKLVSAVASNENLKYIGLNESSSSYHNTPCNNLQYSHNGKTFVTCGDDGAVRAWDISTGELVMVFRFRSSCEVTRAFYSPDDSKLVTANARSQVLLFDFNSGSQLFELKHPHQHALGPFSPDGKYIASGSGTEVILWDAETGSSIRTLSGHQKQIHSLSFDRHENLFSCSLDGYLLSWSILTGDCLMTISLPNISFRGNEERTGYFLGPCFEFYHPNDEMIIYTSVSSTLTVFDLFTKGIKSTLKGAQSQVYSVQCSRDGYTVAASDSRGTVVVWDLTTSRIVHTLKGHTNYVHGLAFSTDGFRIASGGQDSRFLVWDIATGKIVQSIGKSTALPLALRNSNTWNLENSSVNLGRYFGELGLSPEFESLTNSEILNFLRQQSKGGKKKRRTTLMIIGDGEVGKTTLLKKLQSGKFIAERKMTDGIDISLLNVGDDDYCIEYTVFDFAGQKEYLQTHGLFFDSNAVFLALFRKNRELRIYDFLEMINISAPESYLLPVSTFFDEDGEVVKEKLQEIQSDYPQFHLEEYVPVDSKSHHGVEEVRKRLRFARGIAERYIPNSYTDFENALVAYAEKHPKKFCISQKECCEEIAEQFGLDEEATSVCLKLFNIWKIIFILPSGMIALRPQQLVDVFACVFTAEETTKTRQGKLKEGVLLHDDKSLAIWKKEQFDESLWRMPKGGNSKQRLPDFLVILHQAGLAYEIFGGPIGATLIPSLLPESLPGVGADTSDEELIYSQIESKEDEEYELYAESKGESTSISSKMYNVEFKGRLDIHFKRLPESFFHRLQSKTSDMAVVGGAWRHGCILRLPGSNSHVILRLQGPCISILAVGNTSARSVVLRRMEELMTSSYKGLKRQGFKLIYDGMEWDQSNITQLIKNSTPYLEWIGNGIHVNKGEACFISVSSLRYLCNLSNKNGKGENCCGELDSVVEVEMKIPKEILVLNMLVRDAKALKKKDRKLDTVNISIALHECIESFLSYLGINFQLNAVSTLWVILESDSVNATTSEPPECCLMPLSPGRYHADKWVFVHEAKIPLTTEVLPNALFEIPTVILKDTFEILNVKAPKGWRVKNFAHVPRCEDDMTEQQSEHFEMVEVSPSPVRTFSLLKKEYAKDVRVAMSVKSLADQISTYNSTAQNLFAKMMTSSNAVLCEVQGVKEGIERIEGKVDKIASTLDLFKLDLDSLRSLVINLNECEFPTKFLLVPDPKIGKHENEEERVTSMVEKASILFAALKDPNSLAAGIRASVEATLTEKYYISLICEECLLPQMFSDLPGYEMSKPAETVSNLLPLLKVGFTLSTVANKLSGLGRIFGFPTPVLSDETMEKCGTFLKQLSVDTLDGYTVLQRKVQERADGGEIEMSKGFCARQFKYFLQTVDPKAEYCGLVKQSTPSTGKVAWICESCSENEVRVVKTLEKPKVISSESEYSGKYPSNTLQAVKVDNAKSSGLLSRLRAVFGRQPSMKKDLSESAANTRKL